MTYSLLAQEYAVYINLGRNFLAWLFIVVNRTPNDGNYQVSFYHVVTLLRCTYKFDTY